MTTVTGISDANWNIDAGTATFDDPNGELEVSGVSGDNIVGAHDQRTLNSVDHYAKGTVTAFTWAGAERQVGVCTRYVNTGAFTGYSMEVDDAGGTIIIEVTGASPNTIASGSSSTVTVGDEIMAVSEGTGHRLYINGSLVLSANDATHTTETRGGLHFHTDSASSTIGWGSWEAGALSDVYPTVAATNTGATTSGSSFSVPMPSGVTAGDLLLIWAAHDSNGTSTALAISGWTQLFQGNNGTVVRHGCWAKIAAGGDTATITGSANDTATVSARITGHGVSNVATDIKVGTAATGSTAAPNPPSLNTGASADYLWFESFGADDDDNAATYWTTGFAGVAQSESAQSTSSCMVGVGRMSHTAQTLDPGDMAMAAAEEWVANTIAIPPAAAGTDLVVADASQGQTADNVVLTQTHVLTTQDAAQTQTADNVTLTQVHQLAVADGLQTQAADNVVLEVSSATNLVVQDATQGQTADNVTLTQVHQLTVADAAQAQAADGLALTQVHNLAVSDATQAQTSDSVALTQVHVLAVQDAVQGHSADNVVLTVGGVDLVVADALHGHVADNVTLTQVHQLAVADGLQTQSADSPGLTQTHVLSVADALQVQTSDNVVLFVGDLPIPAGHPLSVLSDHAVIAARRPSSLTVPAGTNVLEVR